MDLTKTRSDAWGEDLPEETRWEIYGFTKPPREGDDESRPHLKSYEDAREHAAARGITPPSRAGWYRFLARMREAGYTPDPAHPVLGQHLASETVERTVYLYAVVWIPVLV